MDKKQTAVEWLISQLQKTRDYQRVINEANQSGSSVRDVIKQAKEMEKERIMKAHISAGARLEDISIEAAEEYYNKTYGGNK
jgi:vacuolar-type H+-ATPase subunit H